MTASSWKNKSPWTAQIDAKLKEYFNAGHKYPEVAELLNREFGTAFSKNACIGRGRRLKVGLRIAPKKGKPPKRIPFPQVFIDRPKPRPGEIGIEDLTSDTCHWPHGEHPPFSYCGKETFNGGPYCRHHAEISYPGITKRVA